MSDPNSAGPVDQSPVSENQDKMVDVYFGVFFDAMDMSLAAHYFNKDEYLRKGDEAVSDVKNSSTYKTVDEVAAWAKFATDVLPDNPVSKAVNTALGVKDTIENKVDDYMGKVGGISDDISDMGKLPTSFGTSDKEEEEGESLLGSGRSIISKLEPCYVGDHFGTNYNFRIYVTGAVTTQEVKQKGATDGEEAAQLDENARKQFEKEGIEAAVNAIKQKIPQPKLFLHFDIFGYTKDPAVNNFISEIDQFKQIPNVNELSIDFKGIYDNFYSKEEVLNSMSEDTFIRFRSLNKL
jgi:hypothetical protein